MLDSLLQRLGYVNEKALGPEFLSAMNYGSTPSPRPNIQNMRDFLHRYADQAWVFSCIHVIQTKGAGVPLKIYKQDLKTGEMLELPDHPLKKLLDSANPFMTGHDLLESTHGFKGLVGNAYWLLDEFVNGRPTTIYPLNPARVRVAANKDKYITGYVYESSPGVEPTPLDISEVLHFKNWNPNDDFYGMSPLSAARDASDAIMGADRYNKMFFENSAEPAGILTSEQPLQQGVFDRISLSWKKMHQGVRKAHKIAILDGGLKWQSTAISQRDMQFPELKKMSREDVLTVYGVPPVMVGVYDQVNYNTAQEQRRIFWIDTMIPELRKLEGVINERLVKPYDPTVIARYDLTEVEALQKDEKFRADTDAVLVSSGVMTINEVRKTRRLVDVDWGDVWHAPIGLSPVGAPDEEPTPAPDANPEDTPPEDPVQDAAP
ncbi:phage portal protein, partial [Candidatus Parcubacteria bacterium]|nr:phage portal protein [Candidatus Parcubacteria bacterium]